MRERVRDCGVLVVVSALLTLPNLGATSLWDVDEGVNAQAAREMRDSGTWVIPTFNYQLRTAKPVMLYWLQRASYAVFGVSEWSARLPSVLAGWLAVLFTYELARRMFGRATGLFAGVVLASAAQFGVLVHAATPDATLLLFTTLTYLVFWAAHGDASRKWWLPTAAACGLAVLTKGPIGVGLPGLVLLVYFAWNRELGRLLDRRLLGAALVFVLVAGPWYGLVAAETRGEWVKAFIGRENLQRFNEPMDRHNGPVWFYLAAILLMFAPWSAFIGAVGWYGIAGTRKKLNSVGLSPSPFGGGVGEGSSQPNPPAPFPQREGGEDTRAHRFLVSWVAVYLLVFSAAATKLPNYIFPLYPALAILTARFLVGWRDGVLVVPRWVMAAGIGGMVVVGVGAVAGLVLAEQTFPGLGVWAVLGLVPLAGAVAMTRFLRRDRRQEVLLSAAVASVVFTAFAVALPPVVVDRQKAPRELVRLSGVGDPSRDLRVATFDWFPPSVTYYTGREVKVLESPAKAAEYLAIPTPAYVFVPEPVWENLVAGQVSVPVRVVARHPDFLEKCNILVVTNDLTGEVARR